MPGRRLQIGLVCLALLASLLVWIVWKSNTSTATLDIRSELPTASQRSAADLPSESSEQLLQRAGQAFQQGDYGAAEELAARVTKSAKLATTANHLAGQAAAYQGKFAAAIGYFDQMTDVRSPDFLIGNILASDLLLNRQHRMSESEERLRRVLQIEPTHTDANLAMYNLLSSCARRREMVSHILAAMRQGGFQPDHLLALGSESRSFSPPPLLEMCFVNEPEYVGVLLGMAQVSINRGETKRARELLDKAVQIEPDFLPAQSRLGALILQESNAEEFLNWHRQLTSRADQDPDIWSLRGEWAEKMDQRPVSIRCYWEAVRLDPNLRTAVFRLSKLLASHGDHDRAEPFLIRSQNLQLLKEQEARLNVEGPTVALIHEIATQMETLGRVWEAWGWCRVALNQDPNLAWAQQQAIGIEAVLRENPPQTLVSTNPARRVDLSDFPLPNWTAPSSIPSPGVLSDVAHGAISFKNVAAGAGLDFSYFSSPAPPDEGRKMYELTGGGVGIIDFDGDGWPDIYLTQGCSWPLQEGSHGRLDRIFQNRADGTVMDVTEKAGLVEDRFSQGVAIGDFDNDGFPDILVGNIGTNRLYHNNGDGTFDDVTTKTGLKRTDWTTSCVICDVNGDGLPDLYQVNYLQGEGIYQRVCKDAKGRQRMCKPTSFEASQDRLHLNLGDGRFEDITEKSGIQSTGGKGLGVVAADFDGLGKLSLFVANDTRANFYFQNQTPRRGDFPVLVEQAYQNGLAFNGQGLAEGCMGIAIGNSNAGHDLDLFVTNFFAESNSLYVQTDGSFDDLTRRAGLGRESIRMLGFGTQFVDADLNGHLDLIVANGHVDDLRDEGVPFLMPPQFFRNQGNGRFLRLSSKSLGEYFEGNYLGRGLARLDWNRDGREDVVVSHIDSPVALLENTTVDSGHGLVIHLRGTRSDRDAIGTTVTAGAGGKVFVHQLTAGDGYQASNQRIVVFGFGALTSIDRLHIRWPSGTEQEFTDIQIDSEVIIIEGQPEPVRISPKVR